MNRPDFEALVILALLVGIPVLTAVVAVTLAIFGREVV